ncbi:MAG: leucine-rich repeat domain-containing protein [Ruminococcus sp.]|nr:leucine-rich repeat domain-containing protein [Ruminococcus sp.]MCM1381153.1 leucine-rich repeat domain-containing protein [Muribaculaceae bacterium]MCM1478814.1 leucine-rich repeat domain-containing protein [Muribaculaceae bacterium]
MAKKKSTYTKKKSLGLRIFIVAIAAAMIVGIIIMPALSANAEGNPENLTVASFETGKLAEAMQEAADGTDYNFIKNIAVLSGTLNAVDYGALLQIPNLEIIELAGTETEDGKIPESAIPSRNQLTLISLPKNTAEIGAHAFEGNRKLAKVLMPATVTKIGDYAFSACESLTDFPVSPDTVYIGEGAFQDCKAITEFVIPAGITEIYPNTFGKCGFEQISIGPDVKKIGASVFADCNNLKDIYAYGETAPALESDVFRNVGATVHCYEDSEESYQSWVQQNIKIAADLTGEYELTVETPEENSEKYSETTAAENSETEEEVPETTAGTEREEESPAETTAAAENNSGGMSVGVVIVIAVMAAVIAVLATVLVMSKKKG